MTAELDAGLRAVLAPAAFVGGLVAGAVLGLAIVTEAVRRRAPRLAARLDRGVPAWARRVAVAAAAVAPVAAPSRSLAADDLREWLGAATTTTTTTTLASPDDAPPAVVDPAPPPPAVALPSPVPVDAPAHYVVVAGDCLWTISARHLGPASGDDIIDRFWRQIYATNRAAIGSDPDLIHPGLALTLPPLDALPS